MNQAFPEGCTYPLKDSSIPPTPKGNPKAKPEPFAFIPESRGGGGFLELAICSSV